jgi:signal peptide peptidase SppA
MTSLLNRVAQTFKTGLALVGVAATAVGCWEYNRLYPDLLEDDEKKKNRVLVIPFHRLKIVEQKDSFKNLGTFLANVKSQDDDSSLPITVELRELVDVLHHAASDPTISSVYGVFGHGGKGIEEAGWAQLEEIRNSLQVIKESHRRHPEPNMVHGADANTMSLIKPKQLYAYTDSFASVGSPSNRDYYLASVFNHIHMQEKGELNLFGFMSQQFFLRELLEKYGIQLHVFKQGHYKNAPNLFTERTFNRYHYANVSNIQKAIEDDVCNEITDSRSKEILASWLTKKHRGGDDNATIWKRIRENGKFPGEVAVKAGFVDSLPRRDPLVDLVDDKKDNEVKANWTPQETDFDSFPSSMTVSLKDYSKEVAKKKKASERRQFWHHYIAKAPTLNILYSLLYRDIGPAEPVEHIALLQVDGMIGDTTANKLVNEIRKIRKDDKTKCVVVRVSSGGGSVVACETIQQELKSLNVPIVFSFGNVSASGGYYIASSADRIFCSKKTVTGSIGVFGIRMDLTGLAAKYGVRVEHIASGDLTGTYQPFYPMNYKMKKHLGNQIDRFYAQFKTVVSEGRNIPFEKVETLAQGRVWTGTQAKSHGLVDELGGLHRALAYARRTYTSSLLVDGSDVVVWPRKDRLFQRLMDESKKGNMTDFLQCMADWYMGNEAFLSNDSDFAAFPACLSDVLMVADENMAIRALLEQLKSKQTGVSSILQGSFWS